MSRSRCRAARRSAPLSGALSGPAVRATSGLARGTRRTASQPHPGRHRRRNPARNRNSASGKKLSASIKVTYSTSKADVVVVDKVGRLMARDQGHRVREGHRRWQDGELQDHRPGDRAGCVGSFPLRGLTQPSDSRRPSDRPHRTGGRLTRGLARCQWIDPAYMPDGFTPKLIPATSSLQRQRAGLGEAGRRDAEGLDHPGPVVHLGGGGGQDDQFALGEGGAQGRRQFLGEDQR